MARRDGREREREKEGDRKRKRQNERVESRPLGVGRSSEHEPRQIKQTQLFQGAKLLLLFLICGKTN